MSYQLLLETSTNFGLVSLAQDDRVIQTLFSTEPKGHTEKAHDFVRQILQSQNLTLDQMSFLSCGIGPGSFTGIRVSVNAMKTLSFLLNKPIVELNTLEVLAMNYFMNSDEEFVFVATNAFKNMVYHCLYRRGQDLRPIRMMTESSVFVKHLTFPSGVEINSCGLAGDGYDIYQKYIPEKIFQIGHRLPKVQSQNLFSRFDYPDAEAAVRLAWLKFQAQETKDWKSISPLYIRASEAEENLKGMKYIPL